MEPAVSGVVDSEKELIPIILACEAWGEAWCGRRILCHCDNQSVVADLRSRSSKHKGMMHLLRCLVFLEAYLYPMYINTKENHLADNLSRGNTVSFLSKVPGASPHPTPVSTALLHLLLDPQADWTSLHWRRQFSGISRRVNTEDLPGGNETVL